METYNTQEEVMRSDDVSKWREAGNEEFKSVKDLKSYKLVKTLIGRKHIPTKWVFKIKEDKDGHVIRYKSRWIVKSYMLKLGIYYDLKNAPI